MTLHEHVCHWLDELKRLKDAANKLEVPAMRDDESEAIIDAILEGRMQVCRLNANNEWEDIPPQNLCKFNGEAWVPITENGGAMNA